MTSRDTPLSSADPMFMKPKAQSAHCPCSLPGNPPDGVIQEVFRRVKPGQHDELVLGALAGS